MSLKVSSAKWRPFCLGLNVLRRDELTTCDLPLQWRHNEHNGVSNHQPHDRLLNRLFKTQIKENIKAPLHWPLGGGGGGGDSPVTGDLPAQGASNVEDVSIWWRHHVL